MSRASEGLWGIGSGTLRRLSTSIALGVALAVNAAANALPINGRTTGEVSDRFQVFFTPAGYVFSIWGVIYTGLIALAVYQWTATGRRDARMERLAAPLTVNLWANAAWILCWHYELFAASVATIVVMLASLVASSRVAGPFARSSSAPNRWLVNAPISLYTAWISVATLANMAVWLEAGGLRPFGLGAEPFAAWLVAIAGVTTVAVVGVRRDPIYAGVVLWALAGIVVANAATGPVAYAALLAATAIALTVIVRVVPWHRQGVRPRLQPSQVR